MISVIVPVFNRTQFVSKAIASIDAQTEYSDSLELIVITNTALPSDMFAGGALRPRVINSQDPSLGGKIAEAAATASGDLIAFLEDDDLWFAGKLARIQRVFSSHPDLVFYHNRSRPVDANGLPLDRSLRSPGRAHAPSTVPLLFTARDTSYARLRRVITSGLDSGMSSMAIRHRLLLDNLEVLRRIRLSVDVFLLYCGLTSGGSLLDDPEILTGYRVHGANASVYLEGPGADLDSFLRSRGKVDSVFRSDRETLRELLGARMTPGVRKSLACYIAEDQLHVDFFSNEARTSVLARHVLDYFTSTSTSDIPYSVILTLFGLSNMVSRRAAESIYSSWTRSSRMG